MKKPDLILNHISLVNFKNYDDAEIKLCSSVNCFLGDNGSGKTNVLDAIHYLSMCKSYFNTIDSQNVKRDTAFFSISGLFEKNGDDHKIHCAVKPGQKKIFKKKGKAFAYKIDGIKKDAVDHWRDGERCHQVLDKVISSRCVRHVPEIPVAPAAGCGGRGVRLLAVGLGELVAIP